MNVPCVALSPGYPAPKMLMPDTDTRTAHHRELYASRRSQYASSRDQDRYAPIKRLAMIQIQPPRNPNKPLTPFSITDILNGRLGTPSGRPRSRGSRTADPDISHRQQPSSVGPIRTTPAFPGHVPSGFLPGPPGLRLHGLRGPTLDPRHFIRPWDSASSPGASSAGDEDRDAEEDEDEEIDIEDEKPPPKSKSGQSPLDALLKMTSKTFDGRAGPDGQLDGKSTVDG